MILRPRIRGTTAPKIMCTVCGQHPLYPNPRTHDGKRVWWYADRCKSCASKLKFLDTQKLLQAKLNQLRNKNIIDVTDYKVI